MAGSVLNNAAYEGAVNPRIQVVAGPLKDSVFVLSEADLPIGRDPSNLLSISDLSLSRRHCVLTRNGDSYKICDFDSRNGTFVNGVAVKESPLHHGDQVSIGDSIFVLLLREETDEPNSGQERFDDHRTQATAQLRPQDALYLQPERVLRELPANSRLARNLNALLKISRVVHSIRDLEELQSQILNLTFEIVPAERGAILLDGNGSGKFESEFGRHRLLAIAQPVQVRPHHHPAGAAAESRDSGSGRSPQRQSQRCRKPAQLQCPLAVMRAAHGFRQSNRLHLSGHHPGRGPFR